MKINRFRRTQLLFPILAVADNGEIDEKQGLELKSPAPSPTYYHIRPRLAPSTPANHTRT